MAVLTVLLQLPEILDSAEPVLLSLIASPFVKTIWISSGPTEPQPVFPKCRMAPTASFNSGVALNSLLSRIETSWLLMIPNAQGLDIPPTSLERLLDVAERTGAGLVYADFRERGIEGRLMDQPLLDYQLGSIRDTFDFGPLMLFSVAAITQVLNSWGAIPPLEAAGLYDLRLKLSLNASVFHLPEFLCTRKEIDARSSGEKIFDYVRADQQTAQQEMETVATAHLQRLGAYLPPVFETLPPSRQDFPVEASVIIPVRNRRRTIIEAVDSALSQKTDFPFNVLVVDNFSTDGTSELLAERAGDCPALHHSTLR